MSKLVGLTFPAPPEAAGQRTPRATKADLVAEAESLGIEVPEGATKQEVADLVKEAREQ